MASPCRTVSPWVRYSTGGTLGCRPGGAAASADQRGDPGPRLCLGRLCAVCHGGAVAGLVLWRRGQSPRGVVLGASGWPAGHGAPPGGRGCPRQGGCADTRAAHGRVDRFTVGAGGRRGDVAV